MGLKDFFKDKLSVKKTGTGSTFISGNLNSGKAKGLAKALRDFKLAGKHTFAANLSKNDLSKFQGMIGKELKGLSTGSSGLSMTQRRKIMMEAEQMRAQGKISKADKEDLRNMVEALGKGGASASGSVNSSSYNNYDSDEDGEMVDIKPMSVSQRRNLVLAHGSPWAAAFGEKDKKGEPILTPRQQKNVRASIRFDIATEMAENRKGPPVSMAEAEAEKKKKAKEKKKNKDKKKSPNMPFPTKSQIEKLPDIGL